MGFNKAICKIPSVTPGWDLDTWTYIPTTGSKPYPVVIMAHGFTANKLMGLAPYAEAFASAGYACLVFDYRSWGASDGTPRNVVNVNEQLEDYRTVIKYARQQQEFDSQRVVVWGTSFSGGHAVTLAAEPSLNLVGAVSQCPYLANTAPITPNFGVLKTVLFGVLDLLKLSIGLSPVYIKAASEPGEVGILAFSGAQDGLFSITPNAADYQNQVAASALFSIPTYKPLSAASKATCPFIIIAPEGDNLCLLETAEEAVKAAGDKGELAKVPGTHFDVYPPHSQNKKSLEVQLEFLQKHVPL